MVNGRGRHVLKRKRSSTPKKNLEMEMTLSSTPVSETLGSPRARTWWWPFFYVSLLAGDPWNEILAHI